jgi:hypothetical protein
MNEELDELYEKRRNLADKIANYFKGGKVYEGDKGYQDLLQELDEVNMEIDSINNNDGE